MPKDAIRARRTTKTLAAIIRRLFERSGVTAEQFARDIGLKRTSLYHLFTGTNGIKYQVLERIERRLGVPTGIILCMSHSAALVREAEFGKSNEKQLVARAGIELMSAYLSNLQTVLMDPDRHPERLKYVAGKKRDGAAWIAMLDEIMDVTRGTPDRLAPTVFTAREFAERRAPMKAVAIESEQDVKKRRPPRNKSARSKVNKGRSTKL